MRLKKKGIIAIIAIILVLVVLAVSAFFIFKDNDEEKKKPKKDKETVSSVSDNDDTGEDENDDDFIDVSVDSNTEVERKIKKTQDLKGKVYFTNYKTAKTLYYINIDNLDVATVDMLMSLQGIVAKTESQIYLYESSQKIAFETLKKTYGIKMVEVEDPWDLVDRFKSHLNKNGYVRYIVYNEGELYFDEPFAPDSVNVAATIAGQENYLMIDESLVNKAKSHGLVERENALNYDGYMIFQKYKDKINQKIFASIANFNHSLYDVSVSLGCMAYRGDEMEWMLSQMEQDGYVIGWYANEAAGVKIASLNGYATLPLDWAKNFTVYAGLKHEEYKQKSSIKYAQDNKKDVHYVTFIMSDGDNLNYDLSMMTSKDYYGTQNHGDIPFGWSYSPATYEWLPLATKYLYSNMSYNDNFLAAVNGYGYMHPDIYPENKLEDFAKRTAEYMKMTDMKYITLASFIDDTSALDRFIPCFSQYDQILGGHFNDMSNYGECYVHSEYGGGVVWYNDKPFIYDREALALDWQITKDRRLTISDAISQMAYRINNVYERNINSIEGYTIINVHPWSVTYEDCIDLVEQFNDDVVVVTPSEFFELVTNNVPHEDYLDMFGKNLCGIFDYTDADVKTDNHFVMVDAFERLKATSDLSFDFTGNKGTGSWRLRSGTTTNDRIYYTGNDVYMSSQKTGGANDLADNQIYNKIKLPQGAKTLTYSVKGNAATRLLAVTEDGTVINLSYWDQMSSNAEFTDITVDISKVAGKTVTLLLQMQDYTGGLATCSIRSVTIS